jgi:hypothetical protein
LRYHGGGNAIGRQRDKLIEKARASPASLTFEEALRLAGHGGLRLKKRGGKGSHCLLQRDHPRVTVCLTDRHGECPAYQVVQLLAKLDFHGLLD